MRAITVPLILLVIQVCAQPYFIRRHALPANTVVNAATVTLDQGMAVCGRTTVAGHDNGMILKLDVGGGIQWSRSVEARISGWVPDTCDVDFRDVVSLENGDLVLVGNTERMVAQMLVGGRVLIRYDAATGDTIWKEHSEAFVGGALGFNDIALDALGRLVLGGTRYSVFSLGSYLGVADPSNAATVLEKSHTRVDDSEMTQLATEHVVPLPDLGFVAIMNGAASHVVRFDQNMDTLWNLHWPQNTFEAAVRLANNTYVAYGASEIHQINSDGTAGWNTVLGNPLARIRSVAPHPSEGFYLLGSENAPVPFSWLAHVSSDGIVQWCRRYAMDNDAVLLTELLIMPDGSLRMVGRAATDLLIIGADSSGSLSGCVPDDHDLDIQPTSSGPEPTLDLMESLVLGSDLGEPQWDHQAFPPGQDSLYCHSGLWLITGSVFHDLNGDGVRDGGEQGLPFIPVHMVPEQTITYSNAQGGLSITTVVDGPHEFFVEPTFPWWTTTTPTTSLLVVLEATDFTIEGMDIGLAPVMDTTIVAPSLVSAPTRCSDVVQQTLVVLNQGTTVPDLLLSLSMDPLTTLVGSEPAPDSSSGNVHYWHVDQLQAFQQAQFVLAVQMPGVDQVGYSINAVLDVYEQSDLTQELAIHTWSSVLTCAYDPNDKQVEPVGFGPDHIIAPDTEWLTYTVRFQNTGTDTAFTVVIWDALSPNVRPTTLQVLATSHELTQLNLNGGGQLSFHFDNILLPDSGTNEPASQGFVRFRVKPVEDLPNGVIIPNSAQIHFDQNPAIHTNQVFNSIFDCSAFTPWLLIVSWNPDELEPSGEYIPNEFGVNWTQTATPDQIQWFLNGEAIPSSEDEDGNILPWLYPVAPGYYTITITTNEGCVVVSEPYAYFPTEIARSIEPIFQLQPNPFYNQLYIRYTGTHDHIELVDVNGGIVRSQGTGNSPWVKLDRDGLASGIYLLRLMAGTVVVATARVVAH